MFAFQVENSDYVVFGNLQRVGTSLDQDYNFYVFFFSFKVYKITKGAPCLNCHCCGEFACKLVL